MVTIQKMVFKIRTADIEDAGTGGEVYVGFCGRVPRRHIIRRFERGAKGHYSAGVNAVTDEVRQTKMDNYYDK